MYKPLCLIVILSVLFLFPWQAWGVQWSVTVHSANGRYYAYSVPEIDCADSPLGETTVYSASDSSVLYTLQVSLTSGHLFLSNDGSTLVHLINNDSYSRFKYVVAVYVNGELQRSYWMPDLVGEKSRTLFFWSRKYDPSRPKLDQTVLQCPAYCVGDTVLFYTSTRRLVSLSMATGIVSFHPFDSLSPEYLKSLPTLRTSQSLRYSPPAEAVLSNGMENGEWLARQVDMAVWNEDYWSLNYKYKYYDVEMLLRVGRDGKATVFASENEAGLDEEKIRKAIESATFKASGFPEGANCWYQEFRCRLRKRNLFVARQERKREMEMKKETYRRNLTADSIDHIYIPRNLEECFHVLDTMLHPSDVAEIRALGSRESMISFHFGLGRWLRNDWGLWRGSRLQTYFVERGEYHPDGMSGVLLRYYYDYLHGIDTGWRRFDTTLVAPPPTDVVTRSLSVYRRHSAAMRCFFIDILRGYSLRMGKAIVSGFSLFRTIKSEDARYGNRKNKKNAIP